MTTDKAIPERELPLVSVIVTCKGRLHHLRRTLPSMLAQRSASFAFEVIVVDFGCPQGAFDWCRSLDLRQLVAVKVLDDTREYQRSRSRNCGAQVAGGTILAFVDADIFLDVAWLEEAMPPLLAGDAGSCTAADSFLNGWDRGGTWGVRAELFHSLRGYDEELRGWGIEDADLQRRCAATAAESKFPAWLLTPIKHGHAERVRYHDQKKIETSAHWNQDYLARRSGLINPCGYGQGKFEIDRGQGDIMPPVTWARPRRIVRTIRRPTVAKRSLLRLAENSAQTE